MIVIDTNVLLRYLLEDDDVQFEKSKRLITGDNLVLVTDVVLVETIWTLRGKKYQLDKAALANVVLALIEEPNIRFDNNQNIWMALNVFRNAQSVKGKDADFSGALIVNKAKLVMKEQGLDFEGVYTFDKAAQILNGMKAP